MAKLLTTIAVSFLLTISVYAKTDTTSIPEIDPYKLNPIEVIGYYADFYGINRDLTYSISWCESKIDKDLPGDKGWAFGPYQYHKETFYRHARILGEPDLHYESYHDQAKLFAKTVKERPDLLKEWTTYVATQKGGVYSFYSRKLKQYFTIRCKIESWQSIEQKWKLIQI